MPFDKIFNKGIKPYYSRIMMMVARGIVSRIDDSAGIQTVQMRLQKSEVREDLERIQNYGFTSHPLPSAEGAVVFVGGNRDHGLVLAVDDRRYRIKEMAPGEVAIYTDEGDKVHLKRGKNIEIETGTLTVKASNKAVFETPVLECTGEILDRSGSGGISMQSMRETFNNHKHQENPGLSGLTDVPDNLME